MLDQTERRPAPVVRETWQGAWQRSFKPSDRQELEDNAEKLRYLKSWMLMRFLIGALGLTMVLMTWLGSALLPDGHWALKNSLSAYYYSGMREFFTCTLTAIGVFLVAYKAFERTAENLITLVAGLAVVVVAFFPTSRPIKTLPLTPLQHGLGETAVGFIHELAAIVFILFLAVISVMFGIREKGPRDQVAKPRLNNNTWFWVHVSCAAVIVLTCLLFVGHKIGISYGSWSNAHAVWLTEVLCVTAFSTSWTCKGTELFRLLAKLPPTVPAAS